jgi:hypothetical protein
VIDHDLQCVPALFGVASVTGSVIDEFVVNRGKS